MTVRDFFDWLDHHPTVFMGLILWPTLIAIVLLATPRHRRIQAPIKYLYAVTIYATTVPGMLAAVVTGYMLLIARENLMDVSFVSYILPIIAMLVTLMVVKTSVSLDAIPGFDRLLGLMILVGCSCLIVFMLAKTRIWIIFGGSLLWFVLLGAAIFGLLRWGSAQLTQRRNYPD
ncbi:MAG: hypothetical protein KDC35_17260 [Acidobacteria bacterium]|nr:hypothetical protein [Acidobacteriota bacterium]